MSQICSHAWVCCVPRYNVYTLTILEINLWTHFSSAIVVVLIFHLLSPSCHELFCLLTFSPEFRATSIFICPAIMSAFYEKRGGRFRPSAIIPFALSSIAFVLTLLLVLSGTRPDLIQDGYLLSVSSQSTAFLTCSFFLFIHFSST